MRTSVSLTLVLNHGCFLTSSMVSLRIGSVFSMPLISRRRSRGKWSGSLRPRELLVICISSGIDVAGNGG